MEMHIEDRLEIEIQVYTQIIEELRDKADKLYKEVKVNMDKNGGYTIEAIKLESKLDELTDLMILYKKRVKELKQPPERKTTAFNIASDSDWEYELDRIKSDKMFIELGLRPKENKPCLCCGSRDCQKH